MIENTPDSTSKRISIHSVFPFVFFLLYFLYVWRRIDPSLTYQEQESVYFFGVSFFSRFIGYPGGLTEYLSSLLSQFFIHSWAGALIVTFIAWLVTLATSKMIRCLKDPRKTQLINYFPAIFMLMLHSHYKHPLAVSLGYLLSLVFFNTTLRLAPEQKALRLLAFGIMSPVLYCIAGGPFLLFASLCVLREFFLGQGPFFGRLLLGFSCVLLAAAIPFISREILFMVTLKNAYETLLPFQYSYKPALAPYILYAFPLVLVTAAGHAQHRAVTHTGPINKRPSAKKKRTSTPLFASLFSERNKWAPVTQAILVLITAGAAAFFSFDPVNHALLQVDYYARRQMWPQVLRAAKSEYSEYGLVTYHVNRALYHLNLLPDKLFSYPQKLGINGLFFPKRFQYLIPLQISDLFYEMGHVNEAQHWAHEAVSQRGETPWNCQRLVQTYILKNEKEAAREYIALLKKTPLHRNWAERAERLVDHDSLRSADGELRELSAVMPDSDFVVNSEEPYSDLDAMLSEKKQNRMAFEYLMAAYLLKGKIGKFANRIGRLKDFQYHGIPKSYNEALMLYFVEKQRLPAGLSGHSMDQQTVQRYEDFYKILSRYRWNRLSAMGELQRSHFDTYWYYVSYFKPAADRENSPESPLNDGTKK
jgi:hypothetical protein